MSESKLLPKQTTWKYRYSMALIDAEFDSKHTQHLSLIHI